MRDEAAKRETTKTENEDRRKQKKRKVEKK